MFFPGGTVYITEFEECFSAHLACNVPYFPTSQCMAHSANNLYLQILMISAESVFFFLDNVVTEIRNYAT